MKEDRLALVKAVNSGDPDLVFHVLLNLKSRLSPGDFFALVDDGSAKLAPAVKLLQVYAKENDRDLLRDFYYQDDRRLDSAMLEMEEGWAKAVSHHDSSIIYNVAELVLLSTGFQRSVAKSQQRRQIPFGR